MASPAEDRSGVPRRFRPAAGSWYHGGVVLRRALALLVLPLLAACPTFAYGPEAYEIRATAAECEAALLEEDCTRFQLDNGTLRASDQAQPVLLQLGFRSDFRNLVDLHLRYEIPGRSPIDAICPLVGVSDTDTETGTGEGTTAETGDETGTGGDETGTGTGGDTEGDDAPVPTQELTCVAVGLADGIPTSTDSNVARTAEGVMAIQASIVAPDPGSYAISAWLVDANRFESPVVRWQFPVIEP